VTADNRLTDVFDRGLRDGLESLSPTERELFSIQDFIIEYEMGGLSSYFYNRLPDLKRILAAVAAMRRHSLSELATLLGEAAELFAGYVESAPSKTWNEILREYDPADRLNELHGRIDALEDYGLDKSSIA
jgi:hypothetical protein